MSFCKRVMFLIDGENLVCRYQNMKKNGRKPLEHVKHERDVYVWRQGLIKVRTWEIVRVVYYCSATGDDDKLRALNEEISRLTYGFSAPGASDEAKPTIQNEYGEGTLVPRMFKKQRNSETSKQLDISLTIEMLGQSQNDGIDAFYLLSGDGDFIPLIEAVMRNGKQVHIMALSDGLNPKLKVVGDSFECIDSKLFQVDAEG